MAEALERMLLDKRRHAHFGWLYLTERHLALDAETCGAIAVRANEMLGRFYAGGLMVPGFAPAVAGEVAAAYETAAAAGLGTAPLATQRAALERALGDARLRLKQLGVDADDVRLPV